MESVPAAWSVLALSCTPLAAAVPVPASHTRPAPQGGPALCFLFFPPWWGRKGHEPYSVVPQVQSSLCVSPLSLQLLGETRG